MEDEFRVKGSGLRVQGLGKGGRFRAYWWLVGIGGMGPCSSLHVIPDGTGVSNAFIHSLNPRLQTPDAAVNPKFSGSQKALRGSPKP